MNGGGFGARGEIERTTLDDSTRRVVSIRTAVSMAVILNAITLCVYLVIWLLWWWILIRAYKPSLSASGFLRWWQCVTFVVTEWGRVMGRTWPLWVILLPLEWPTPLLILYCRNLYPKLLNDNWPPPWAQADPATLGAVTWHDWDARTGVGALEVAQPQAQLITLEIVEGATRRYLTDIELTAELQSFCRRVLAKTITFSEGGADACDWPKTAFADLRDQMIERKFIEWKNAENTRSGYYFHPIAWRALEELAELPLPR